MSLAELMPAVKSLSSAEKLELRQILDAELSSQPTSESDRVAPGLDPDLLRQFAAAASLYQDPVEITPEGIRILEQVLAEARGEGR